MAFRNIFRQKRRTLLTVLMMLGGFALSSISIAWSEGTYSRIIDMFTRNSLGHIQIHRQGYLDKPSIYRTIDEEKKVFSVLENTQGVTAYAPRVIAAALVSAQEKSAAARVIGIDPELEDEATRFSKKIVTGTPLGESAAHMVVLDERLAEMLRAGVSDTLVLVSQAADGSIANDLYVVTGLLSPGNTPEDRSTIYLHIDDAQELFVLGKRIHEVAVICGDLDEVPAVMESIENELHEMGLEVDSWKEVAGSFYRAMKADQQGAWILLFVILLVVAVGVLNTVLMSVLERTREYGMLRAVGTRPRQMFELVLCEVFIMAVLSVALGALLAVGVNYYLSIEGIGFGTSLTYGGVTFNRMYTELNIRSYIIPGVCVLLTALIVAVYPALRAASVAPARALRTH